MDARDVGRLIWWNRLWLTLLLVGAICWGAQRLLDQVKTNTRALNIRWQDGGLKLSSVSDGPFLVTHLVRLPGHDAREAIAQIPTPLAIIDSSGAKITRDEYLKLVWKNYTGTPAIAPVEGAPLRALYVRPVYSEPARFEPTGASGRH